MERGKMSSSGRGGKSKAPQHPQDIFALGTKSTVVVSRDSEKRNIHKPSSSGVERKRETTAFGSQPPSKRARIGSPAEAVGGTSLEVDPVDLVPNVLQALDTLNSDKLLGLLTGSIRLLKSQRSKPDPVLCMSLLYLTKIRPNMFAHETVTNSLCTLLKREQGAAFKNKGNPLVFVLACNMLYAGHRESNNWPDVFIKVYIEDALNERWWVECAWCKCLVENIVTAFGTKQPPGHLIPTDNTLGTMSPSGSGSPLMGSNEDEVDNTDLEFSVFPRYSASYESVEALVLEAIKEQIQRRSAAPDAIGKGFLKLLAATCGFPEIRMISASRLEGWLNSGKLWRAAQELLACVCVNCAASGAHAARDHEVLAQLARMRLKTKPLQAAYQSCLREMVADSPALLRSVVTHTLYNELSNVRAPNNMAVLAALVGAQPARVPAAMGEVFLELVARPEEYARPLRLVTRELARALRGEAGAAALVPLARALAAPPPKEPPAELRERAFLALAELFACAAVVAGAAAAHARAPDQRALLAHVAQLQAAALGWLLDAAEPVYRPPRADYLHALNKIMFVESADTYAKLDNWPPEAERALVHRLCCEAPLPQNNLLRIIFIGLSKEIPVSAGEVFDLIETLVRRACALPPEDNPLQVDKLEIAEYIFQLCQFNPPDNITLPQGYTPPPLAITSLYWRAWVILTMIAAHNPHTFAERAANTYPTLRALIETCITNKPSLEWSVPGANGAGGDSERSEAERAAILQLETHLAAASSASGKAGVPVAEHASRLLPQLCALEPGGAARRPPQAALDALLATAQQLRLGRLLARAPALLLALVERHGTRRALPWLSALVRGARLPLAALPVQCLCELLAAGGERAPELRRHLRAVLADSEGAARAVLHHYTQRLQSPARHARKAAHRGLRLVLAPDTALNDTTDYDADVGPEEWLELLWGLRQWEAVREEVVARLRAACLVECVPRHLAAYINFLAQYCTTYPDRDNTDIVLELSQVVMERTAVMSRVVGTGENTAPAQHRALHSLTQILYSHLQKVRMQGIIVKEDPSTGSVEGSAWGAAGERVLLAWPSGPQADVHLIVAHAHLKLLCLGPSMYDTDQEMYSWLVSVWVGEEAPAPVGPAASAECLLPDWLRLQLVRSGRAPLLAAGLRALSAHKLALFIQTFGMPVQSMSALLSALDACPAGAVARLGVERGYLAQLLRVQRARGAVGGAAFAAALGLAPPPPPPDENLFASDPLPEEMEDDWESEVEVQPLQPELVTTLLATVFGDALYPGDLDSATTDLVQLLTSEATSARSNPPSPRPYTALVTSSLCELARAGAVRRPAHAAAILRALAPVNNERVTQMATTLLSNSKYIGGPALDALRALAQPKGEKKQPALPTLPKHPSKEELVSILESTTAGTLEEVGTKMIETQDSRLMVDVITQILENNQDGHYDTKVKFEEADDELAHVFSSSGRGCGLLLDWLAELQRETIPERQMWLMFRRSGCRWRALLSALAAHRASWRALHHCLDTLLTENGGWSGSAVLEFAETLGGSPRVWQTRDTRAAPHDTLRLTYKQLEVLIRYIVEEGEAEPDLEGMRRRFSARLPLVLRCCSSEPALLAAARAAALHQPHLLLLLYMKVPKIRQLLAECEERPQVSLPALEQGAGGGAGGGAWRAGPAGAGAATSAADRVSHTVLTALTQPHINKEHSQKVARLEGALRAAWSRWPGAGARALPLAGALLRGAGPATARHTHHLLAVLEALPDDELFADEEIHNIIECFSSLSRGAGLQHRVSALLRRLAARAARPPGAASALTSAEVGGGASASPPPQALRALQRRTDTPENLLYVLQEVESWGVRRGGGWGGASCASTIARAAAPLAAHTHAGLRTAALGLLAKLLPAVPDPTPGVQAILECLDSNLPEVRQSAIDKLPDLIVGMQEHASRVLMRVFELGMKSRLPVDQCLAKCVATINMQRGC